MPTANQPNVITRKIAVMGYPCVGKSSLTQVFVRGAFPNDYDTTIEDFHEKKYDCLGNSFKLCIIDTAGQQQYSLFPRSCSTGVDGYMLVYGIDNRESFDLLKVLRDKILDNAGTNDVPTIVVGNKLDLRHTQREVSTEEGKALAAGWSNALFIEASAKENQLVSKIFEDLLLSIEKYNGNIIVDKQKSCVLM